MKKNRVLKEIEKIAQGNEAEINMLIEIFTRQTSHKLVLLHASLLKKDWKEIENVAHFLKSNFLVLKMWRPAEITEYLRQHAGFEEKETNKQVQELIQVCQEVISELNKDN